MRVLQVSHGWEARGGGGAERAAAALAGALGRRPDVEAELIACVAPEQLDSKAPLAVDDVTSTRLIVSQTDSMTFSWVDAGMARSWREVLRQFQPDVVHMHHYMHAGIELPLVVKQELPNARVVLTLHEFLAMCARAGQLVQRGGQLCHGPGIRKCSDCMEWPVALTASRDHYVRTGLSHVDAFTSPSEFLANRYLEWGLDPESVTVIPNVLEQRGAPSPEEPLPGGTLRIGYLGQHTPLKGVGVLLDAVDLLPKRARRACSVEVYGGGASRFGQEFEQSILGHSALRHPEVRLMGAYSNERVSHILGHLDLIVVPSTWWENSPVVIEEALSRRVPILCSGIGGMAEKVRPGIDGWHFRVGDPRSLAERLTDIVCNGSSLERSLMREPEAADVTAGSYLRLYRRLERRGETGCAGHTGN